MVKKTTAKGAATKTAPAKNAIPKKKTVIEKVEALLEPITPPDTVVVEETRVIPKEVLPDPLTGPNEKFPFGVLVRGDAKGLYYDRFKTAKEQEKFKRSIERGGNSGKTVELVNLVKPAAATPIHVKGEVLKDPKDSPKGPSLVTSKPEPTVSKRVTPGARIDMWRIARSVRVGQPGFFLQGGHIEKHGHIERFVVGEEEYFTNDNKCKEAYVAKLPASDDPEEVQGGKKAK